MLKPFNITTGNSNLFITSDTHFNHDKPWIYEYRGFKSIQEHDEEIIRRWNAVVKPEDQVLHLGDFLCDGSEKLFNSYVARLNGRIYMLFGNHNSGSNSAYKEEVKIQFGRDDIEVYPLVRKDGKVTFLGKFVEGFIDKRTAYVACHFAIRTWPYNQKGSIQLCGHSHGNDPESNPTTAKCKRIDCGIDNFPNLVSIGDVLQIMDTKTHEITDHHVPDSV